MATADVRKAEWTLGDAVRRFGSISLRRIRRNPAPGTATEKDLLAVNDRKTSALCELVDGVLLEKVRGWDEAYLASEIAAIIRAFVRPRRLGVVAGADAPYRIAFELIRLPDVSFISRDRLPGGKRPRDPICPVVPNLAVEILSPSNTRKEMADKLRDYFAAGVELVWYVDPVKKTVRIYTSPDESRSLDEEQTLDGGAVLPGFVLRLRELFAESE